MNEKLNLAELEPLIREIMEKGGEFKLKTNGVSMRPLLGDGTDSVFLVSPKRELDVGDIAFYKRESGQFVLHRVVGKRRDGYVMRGDNQIEGEYRVPHKSVIAEVTAVEKNGKRISVNDAEYLKYVKRLKFVYLSKRLRHALSNTKNKLFKPK